MFLIILSQLPFAQNKMEDVKALKGFHDMAANFKFNTNGNFEFGYFYGASEYYSSETYTIIGDIVKLISSKGIQQRFFCD